MAMTTKEALIRGNASLQGKKLSDLLRAGEFTPSLFYAVVKGEKRSEAIDRYIAENLNIDLDTLRGETVAR